MQTKMESFHRKRSRIFWSQLRKESLMNIIKQTTFILTISWVDGMSKRTMKRGNVWDWRQNIGNCPRRLSLTLRKNEGNNEQRRISKFTQSIWRRLSLTKLFNELEWRVKNLFENQNRFLVRFWRCENMRIELLLVYLQNLMMRKQSGKIQLREDMWNRQQTRHSSSSFRIEDIQTKLILWKKKNSIIKIIYNDSKTKKMLF